MIRKTMMTAAALALGATVVFADTPAATTQTTTTKTTTTTTKPVTIVVPTGNANPAAGSSAAPADKHAGKNKAGGSGQKSAMQALDLTDAQRQQIAAIHDDFRKQSSALFNEYHDAMQNYRAVKDTDEAKAAELKKILDADKVKLHDLRAKQMEKIATVLTPEQRKQWEQVRSAQKKQMARTHRAAKTNVAPAPPKSDQ